MRNIYSIRTIDYILYFACIILLPNIYSRCHSGYPSTPFHLGTKTPYSFIANYIDSPFNYTGCVPKRIWSLIRHGTRTPGKKMIRKMFDLHALRDTILAVNKLNDVKDGLCEHEIWKLKLWSLPLEEDSEKILTPEGEYEMLELGQRFKSRFPEILPPTYTNSTYKFRFTATQRTKASARYFAMGLFGPNMSRSVHFPIALHRDPVLRFYKLCERWRRDVKKNPASLKEGMRFKENPNVVRTVEDISQRLGFNYTLSFDDVRVIYTMCSFETAWHPNDPSPWCSIFTAHDIQVVEYAEDLKYYWIDGYGYQINFKQACVAFKDMLDHLLADAVSSLPPAVFYFTHSGTLLKVLSYLHLYTDDLPLQSDNFEEARDSRQWRVSRIDAFGTNLAFVLYNCGGELKVLTMHQERAVTLPGCPEGDLCPLRQFLHYYKPSLDCKFHEMCSVDEYSKEL